VAGRLGSTFVQKTEACFYVPSYTLEILLELKTESSATSKEQSAEQLKKMSGPLPMMNLEVIRSYGLRTELAGS
jgi:hypothetical protein